MSAVPSAPSGAGRLTPTMMKVLRQAVQDGGSVVLNGIDLHAGWTRREQTAAYALHHAGLGRIEPASFGVDAFRINDAGRSALPTPSESIEP